MSAEEKKEMNAPEKENVEKKEDKQAETKPENKAGSQEEKKIKDKGSRKTSSRDKKFFDKGNKEGDEFVETVVKINRVAKVVKGGKNFSFSALVVSGDAKGNVGIGFGKSNEVAEAIRKGSTEARKSFFKVNLKGDSIPHEVIGKFKATKVILKPAGAGTGVIAGGAVRALCDAVGIKNILTKSLGSRNPINVVKATIDGFDRLRLKRRG